MPRIPFRKSKKPSSVQTPKKRPNYAFIDNQNLNMGTQKVGWKMDWRRFRIMLKEKYGVEKAYMFIGYMPDYEELYTQMHNLGYLVVLKPTVGMFNAQEESGQLAKPEQKHEATAEKKTQVKGNVDAELVLYAVKEMPHYDKAIIVSGDGDFYALCEYLVEQKKLLHIMTPNWQYSSLLKQFETYIIRLDQLRRELSYASVKKFHQSSRGSEGSNKPSNYKKNHHRPTGKAT